MSSIFKKPKLSPVKGRNGYDMGYRRNFTAAPGMLLPVFHDFANPGDKYVLNSSLFIRTEALQTAALMRLKAHVEWFFVPITHLFSRWNEFFNGTNDIMSSIYVNSDNVPYGPVSTLPLYSVSNVTNFENVTSSAQQSSYLFSGKTTTNGVTTVNLTVDDFGVPRVWNLRRLWDLLGYGNLSDLSSSTSKRYTFLTHLAYHKIFHSHYNLTDWFPNNSNLYSLDRFFNSTNNGNIYYFYPVLSTLHYRPWRKDYFTNLMPQPLFNDSFASFIENSLSTLDPVSSDVNPEVALGSQISEASLNVSKITNFDLGYHSYSSLPSSEKSVLGFNNNANSSGFGKKVGRQGGVASNDVSTDTEGYFNIRSSAATSNNPDSIVTDVSVNGDLSPQLRAADIRSMFAYDKLMRVTAFAGGHYEDQTLAHFGYKMPQGISKEAYFLGAQTTDISINEVVATSTTRDSSGSVSGAGTVIGDIAGKAFGASRPFKDHAFTCPCHGIIMAIFSIEPLAEYATMNVEDQNKARTSLDFYHPEFDNVGMQPFFGDFGRFSYDPSLPGTEIEDSLSGWTYRYAQYKSTFDKVNEGFYDTSKSTWVAYKQFVMELYSKSFNGSRPSELSVFQRFFIFPQYTNDVFLVSFPSFGNKTGVQARYSYDSPSDSNWKNEFLQPEMVYSGDNFLVSADFMCYKTSIMSVHSLPQI